MPRTTKINQGRKSIPQGERKMRNIKMKGVGFTSSKGATGGLVPSVQANVHSGSKAGS